MVILNHETYKEIGSYQLNLLNVYTLLSMLMVIGALLVTTPICIKKCRRSRKEWRPKPSIFRKCKA